MSRETYTPKDSNWRSCHRSNRVFPCQEHECGKEMELFSSWFLMMSRIFCRSNPYSFDGLICASFFIMTTSSITMVLPSVSWPINNPPISFLLCYLLFLILINISGLIQMLNGFWRMRLLSRILRDSILFPA